MERQLPTTRRFSRMKSIGLTIPSRFTPPPHGIRPRRKSPRIWITPIGPLVQSDIQPNFISWTTLLAMAYTKYPQACKALMAFIMDADQYNNWLYACPGLHLARRSKPMMPTRYGSEDPKRHRFTAIPPIARSRLVVWARSAKRPQTRSSDFVLVDMFASYCTGREDAKGAMRSAERQLQRIYR